MRRPGGLHAATLDVLVARTAGAGAACAEAGQARAGAEAGQTRATIELRAPRPGDFVPWISEGDLVAPGAAIGELVVLGRASALLVPRTGDAAATGIALRLPPAVHAVRYGDLLVALDPSLQASAGGAAAAAVAAGSAGATAAAGATAVDGLVFRAPTSGRFYGRSSPDKPAFVAEGAQLTTGTTVCLLEVMKTFHRVTYGGAGLPDTARVRRVLVADGADVNVGEPLLALEA